MGNTTSNSNILRVANDIFNSSVTSILQRNQNNIITNIDANQSVRITYTDSIVNCTDNKNLIDQEITGTINIASNITQETTNEIKNLVQTTLSNTTSQSQEAINELLGGLGTNTEQSTELRNAIINSVNNSVTQETLNTVVNAIQFNQDGNIEMTRTSYTGPCGVRQNLVLEVQAANVIGNIVSSVVQDEKVTEVANKIDQEQKIENTGLSGIIESVGDAVSKMIDSVGKILTSPVSIILYVIAAIAFILIVIPMVNGLSRTSTDGQKNTRTGMVVLLVFAILLLVASISIFVWYYLKTKNNKYPDLVIQNKCEKEYDEVKPVYDQWKKETNEDKRREILLNNKPVLDAYSKCMKLEENK